MISKARVKYIKSLQVKKYRKQEQCFIVEGAKGVQELLRSELTTVLIVATQEFLDSNRSLIGRLKAEIVAAKPTELEQLGSFQTNDSVIAVARMQPNAPPTLKPDDFALVLDDIRDPGNLGTIIRTADWYGIKQVVASMETADVYNPKTISATMGSFVRVKIYYTELTSFLRDSTLDSYGAFLEGENVHKMNFGSGGLVVIGNESAGISSPVAQVIKRRITIPRRGGAESLNASVATAVILDNISRSTTR